MEALVLVTIASSSRLESALSCLARLVDADQQSRRTLDLARSRCLVVALDRSAIDRDQLETTLASRKHELRLASLDWSLLTSNCSGKESMSDKVMSPLECARAAAAHEQDIQERYNGQIIGLIDLSKLPGILEVKQQQQDRPWYSMSPADKTRLRWAMTDLVLKTDTSSSDKAEADQAAATCECELDFVSSLVAWPVLTLDRGTVSV